MPGAAGSPDLSQKRAWQLSAAMIVIHYYFSAVLGTDPVLSKHSNNGAKF